MIDDKDFAHIIPGFSAAASIRGAFDISRSSVISCGDWFSIGQHTLTSNFVQWEQARQIALADAQGMDEDDLFDTSTPFNLFNNFESTEQEHPVLIWQDDHVQSQLMTAFLCYMFKENKWNTQRLHTLRYGSIGLQFWESNIAVLSEQKLIERRPKYEAMSLDSLHHYADIWSQFAGSDLQKLTSMLLDKDVAVLTQNSLGYLLRRLPNRTNGLDEIDEKLLGHIVKQCPSAVRAVADAMGYDDTPDTVGDLYLFHRLKKFASPTLAHPLIKIDNPTGWMRNCTVEVLPLAHEVLAGRANMIELNGLDDWLGGVHLTPDNFVYREDVARAD